MQKETILSLFSEWSVEFDDALTHSESFCVGLISTDKELLFSNPAFNAYLKDDPCQSFINPTFDNLLKLENSSNLIFNGFLTLGDYYSVNSSIVATIYRKQNKLLIIGGINTSQLLEQNISMHQLNREINNLQRDLIKKTYTLENTLSQLNIANEELNKLNADKDRFMQILAHDLRNPFTALLGFSDMLIKKLRKYNTDKIEEFLIVINKTVHKTYNLLEELLLWSKSQSGKLPFEPLDLVFSEICNDVINNLQESANLKKITINYLETERILVTADVNMLKTILRNLISNAIKFSNYDGIIIIFPEINDKDLIITVSDTGIGINPKNQEKLWKLTEQYTTTGTSGEEGTGLGLLLCKEFVEKHGGTIWVESEVGKGSDFKFTIPLVN